MHNDDLARALNDMAAARSGLLTLVSALIPDDFARQRPGGWTLAHVLDHVIESEITYSKLLAHLCATPQAETPHAEPTHTAEAAMMMAASRAAVLRALDGIDDESLYRLARIGHEEYSALSVLENIASHDRDHESQLRALLHHDDARARGDERTRIDVAPRELRARKPPDLNVRPARAEDLPRITEIYDYYINETAITFDMEPWTAAQRAEWFTHYAETGRHRLLVAEADGAILGYTSSSTFRPRRAYETTVEMSIICAHEAVGLGIGRTLYTAIFEALRGEDIHIAYAGITMPNDASVALHEAFGFERNAVMPEVGRKFGRYWDVLHMIRRM